MILSKKGDYDVGHYTLYFIMLMFFFVFMFLHIKSLEGKNFLETTDDRIKIENLITFDKFTDVCFAPFNPLTERLAKGHIDLEKFTESSLQNCYTHDARLTLKSIHSETTYTVSSNNVADEYTFDASQEAYVLVHDEPYLLTMELNHA